MYDGQHGAQTGPIPRLRERLLDRGKRLRQQSFAQIRRTQNQAGQHERWIHLQNFLKLRDGPVVIPSKVVEVSNVEVHGQRERIQLQGTIRFLNGFLLSLLHQEPETEPVMCARRMGTEIDGAAEMPLSGIPIPIEVQ